MGVQIYKVCHTKASKTLLLQCSISRVFHRAVAFKPKDSCFKNVIVPFGISYEFESSTITIAWKSQ